MATLEKFPPMGYVMPGNSRRFMAKNGSRRVLSFTRAATTVVGTLALCHPLGIKRGVEMISPLASTLAEDCRVQESPSTNFSEGGLWAGWEAESAQRSCEPSNKRTERVVIKSRDRIRRIGIFIHLPFLILWDFLPVRGTAGV